MIGHVIGNHRVTAKIADGVTGTVYRAEHTVIGRHVAIKFLHATFSQDAELVERFFGVLRAVSTIEHPSIVEIFDFGYHEGVAYQVMEFMEYETIQARIRRDGRMRAASAFDVARQVADALDALHRAGVVHRSLEADNIALVPDPAVSGGDRAKVFDIGLATLLENPETGLSSRFTDDSLPIYTAPEQFARPATADERSDLYALGAIWFDMLCGRPPFIENVTGSNPLARSIAAEAVSLDRRIAYITTTEPPRPRSLVSTIPAEFEEIVLRLLAKDPAIRHPSAAALAEQLEHLGNSFSAEISSVSASKAQFKIRFSTEDPAPPVPIRASEQAAKASDTGASHMLWIAVAGMCLAAVVAALLLI